MGSSACLLLYDLCCLLLRLQKEEKPKEKEKGKSRNIDQFMEERKHEQEMRERRNKERENWRDARHGEKSAVRRITDTEWKSVGEGRVR